MTAARLITAITAGFLMLLIAMDLAKTSWGVPNFNFGVEFST